jgi:adenylate kinase family enzyme
VPLRGAQPAFCGSAACSDPPELTDAMADRPMRLVSIVGAPGSGKTTVGRRLAARLEVPFVELDAIFHQTGWNDLPRNTFRSRVREVLETDGWVVDGNYAAVQDLVWQEADTVVWLDLPRHVVMRRVTVRTLRRAITRERLWNDNREPLTNFYRLDPERNIIRWTWVKHPEYVERYAEAARGPANAHLRFVRLPSQREIDAFID